MRLLTQNMKDIRELAEDYATEQQIQGTSLLKVSDNMEDGKKNVEDAQEQLKEALKKNKGSNKRTGGICMLLTLIVVVLLYLSFKGTPEVKVYQ
jgi:t-SNARE complex subunit (syntaxin)